MLTAAAACSVPPSASSACLSGSLPRYTLRRKYAELSALTTPDLPLLCAANILKALVHAFHIQQTAQAVGVAAATSASSVSAPSDSRSLESLPSASTDAAEISLPRVAPAVAPVSESHVPTDLLRIIAGMAECDGSEDTDAHRLRIWPVYGAPSNSNDSKSERRPPLQLFRVRPASGDAFQWRLKVKSEGAASAAAHRWCTRPLMWLWAPSFAQAFTWLYMFTQTQSDDATLADAIDHPERLKQMLNDDHRAERKLARRFRKAVEQLMPMLNPPDDGDERAEQERYDQFAWSDALMTASLYREYACLLRARGLPIIEIEPQTQFRIYRELSDPPLNHRELCSDPSSSLGSSDDQPLWLLTSTRIGADAALANDAQRHYCWIRGSDRRAVWRWIMHQRARELLFPYLDWKELLRCVNRRSTAHWAAEPLTDAEIDRWDDLLRSDPTGLSPSLDRWQFPNGLHYRDDPIWFADLSSRVSESIAEPPRRFH